MYLFYGCTGSLLLCWLFCSYSQQGLLLVVVHRLPIAVASLFAEHGLWATRASVVEAPWL